MFIAFKCAEYQTSFNSHISSRGSWHFSFTNSWSCAVVLFFLGVSGRGHLNHQYAGIRLYKVFRLRFDIIA